MSKSSASLTSVMCAHCGDPCNSQYVDNSLTFCCNGCRTVYNILNENGLCDYYNLNEMPGISMRDEIRLSKYDYLDNEEIANKLISFRNNSITHIQFQLPQIHCSSCLYLLENLHKINDATIYDLIIVDEAHKFRSDTAGMYNELQKICRKSILFTTTTS